MCGIFQGPVFVSGGKGRIAIESNRISRVRCCTQSVLATFSFLHKKSLSTTSTQFHRKKKKLANKGIFHILSRLFTIAHFVGYGQELFLNFRT